MGEIPSLPDLESPRGSPVVGRFRGVSARQQGVLPIINATRLGLDVAVPEAPFATYRITSQGHKQLATLPQDTWQLSASGSTVYYASAY